MEMTAYYIPVIGAVCYVVIELIKLIAGGSERMKNMPNRERYHRLFRRQC